MIISSFQSHVSACVLKISLTCQEYLACDLKISLTYWRTNLTLTVSSSGCW